jgi:hypothetical protein
MVQPRSKYSIGGTHPAVCVVSWTVRCAALLTLQSMLTAYRWCRFESAVTLTVEEQRRSKSYSDQVIAWVIETVSPAHNINTFIEAREIVDRSGSGFLVRIFP